ncbi:MAG: iron ABC transporter permease [Thermoflexia bacterium]|nr:MAG: iron ABC transporter permease [Thermoflexia bacterium]
MRSVTGPPRCHFLGLVLLLVGAAGLSAFVGRYPRPGWFPPSALASDPLAAQLVWNLRLPRLLASLLLGATLGASGLTLQMLFRNPLVEPGFLGVSQGAAFGAAFAILFLGRSAPAVQASAVICALLGVLLTSFLARRLRYGGWVLRMVLAGIAVSALFSAGVGLLKYLADPLTQLPEITFWLLGGLWSTRWTNFLAILPLPLTGLAVLFLARWRLNVLSLEEEAAFSLGAAPDRERTALLVAAVSATAAVVSLAGTVGWVGLIVPHLARRLGGADARFAMPLSLLLGGLFVLLCDNLARTLTPGEVPLGILTSFFGASLFVILLSRQRGG